MQPHLSPPKTMARLAVTFTVIFFLFAFSHARTSLDLPENDGNSYDPSITLPESEYKSKTTILLPSEKPETEPDTLFELEPENTDTRPQETETNSDEQIQESQELQTESVEEASSIRPLTIIFRPINRHFPHMHADRRFPFGFPHRCRHHHHHHHFRGEPRFPGREIPYGNDMIMSSEEVRADPMSRDEVRQIPARWVRFHHHGRPSFSERHEMWDNEGMERPFRHEEEEEQHEHEHEHEHEHRHEHGHRHRHEHEEEEGSFLKRFRKFLNQF